MIKNIYRKKNLLRTIQVLFLCAVIALSCKKELYQKESIDLNKAREIEGFKKDGKLQTITFDEFRSHVNSNGLGTLKSVLYSPKNLNNSKSITATLPEINGYVINTSEIKVLEINGSTNYVFSVLPLRPSAVTFRNVTIQEKDNVTTAIMTIYTPTKAWIQNNRLGKSQKFDGKVDVIPLNLNSTNILSISPSMESKVIGKTNALKTGPANTADAQYVCSFVNVWVETPYQCASGMGHWPWDFCNMENPEMRPGYRWEYQTQTTCAWIQTDPPPSGTGETTPNPPPGYDPCATGLPEGTQVPIGTIDETPCDSAVLTEQEDPGEEYELEVLADSINLKGKLDCFKNLSNQGATYYARICADIPNNDKPNDLINGPYIGHAFITITKSNGASFVSQTFGFYPESQFKAVIANTTPSMMVNDQQHPYDASLGVNLSENQFNSMISKAIELAKKSYDLHNYNCTNYALEVFNAGSPTSIGVPDWIVNRTPYSFNYGATPNGLYKKISQMKAGGNNNATISSANAPMSSCN